MKPHIHKKKIRKTALEKRLNHPPKNLSRFSTTIRKKLLLRKEFKKAKTIFFYIPIKNEVDILSVIKKSFKNKNVLVPKIEGEEMHAYKINSLDDLVMGKFQTPTAKENCEKVNPKEIDLILVPGIAFDKKGLRIGFGKGYYDRYLKKINAPKIALAYDFQIHENIPGEIHDERVDLIITETDIINPQLNI